MNAKRAHAPTARPEIDWQIVRDRLETAHAAAQRGWSPGPDDELAILRARARALAQEPPGVETGEASLEIVEFNLASEKFGIETVYVREILPLKDLTPIPCTPAFVLGVIHARGRIVSILDLKRFYDLPQAGLTDLNKVLVLHNAGMEFGVLADAVQGVRSIPASQIQPSLPTLTGIRADHLRGVTSERVVILDAGKLLRDPGIVVQRDSEPGDQPGTKRKGQSL